MDSIIFEDMKYISSFIDKNSCEGKTFLISGANGFLARYMLKVLIYINDYILKEKCNIIALCRNEEDAKEKFKDYLERNDFLLLIQSVEEKIKYSGNVDYIIHAASRANTREFTVNPVGIISANVMGTYNLLEYSKAKNVKGFLFFSSGAIYGDISEAKIPIKEDDYYSIDSLDVKNCYAESKKMGENICVSFYKQYNIATKIIRLGHVYGPGIDLNDGRVFSDFVNCIINNKDLDIKSDGQAKRSFCYVSDAIIGFFLVLFKGNNGDAYNLSNVENTVSINELADILANKVFYDKQLEIRHVIDRNTYHQHKNMISPPADIEKISKLGWKPSIGIQEGFRRTVDSFLYDIKNS